MDDQVSLFVWNKFDVEGVAIARATMNETLSFTIKDVRIDCPGPGRVSCHDQPKCLLVGCPIALTADITEDGLNMNRLAGDGLHSKFL
jgi:hypothetical protein